jgi:hypothetical protein
MRPGLRLWPLRREKMAGEGESAAELRARLEHEGHTALIESHCAMSDRVVEVERRVMALALELERLGATVSMEVHVTPAPADTALSGLEIGGGRGSWSGECGGAVIKLEQGIGHGMIEVRAEPPGSCAGLGGCECDSAQVG